MTSAVDVSRRTPCAIDAMGVTLYRWPWLSIHVPLERVERFEAIRQMSREGNSWVERVVLLTHDGEALRVSGRVNRRRGPTAGGRAQQLNNELARTHRAGAPPADGAPG
jgi:hypothetical protein